MKKFNLFSLLAMSLMLSVGFVSCSDDDDDKAPGGDSNQVTDVVLSVEIETTDDLRDVADFNVTFTDLSGSIIDISDDVAIARNHMDGDSKSAKQLSFPLELKLEMEATFKSDVEAKEYACGYEVKHAVELLNEEGETISFKSNPSTHSMTLDLPNPDATKMRTISSKIVIDKDANGKIYIKQ